MIIYYIEMMEKSEIKISDQNR